MRAPPSLGHYPPHPGDRAKDRGLRSPEIGAPSSVTGRTLIWFPHVTRSPGPGNWAPGISSPGVDGWPSFPFSVMASPIPVLGLYGPPPWLWLCRQYWLHSGEMSCHLGSQTCAPASDLSSLPGGLSLVSTQSSDARWAL